MAVVPAGGLDAASLRTLRAGTRLLLYYADDDVYHERIALWPVDRGRWVMVTPDSDMYDEVVDGSDVASVVEVLLLGPEGRLPAGLPGRAYRFSRLPSADALRRLIREARAYAVDTTTAERLPLLEPVGVQKINGGQVTLDEFYGGAFL
eukprot:11195582-Lingulodinium_polyedra.AAC.1